MFVFSNRQNGHLISIVEIDQTKPNIKSVTVYNVTTVWPNGTMIVPRDAPKCGFGGEKCLKTPDGERDNSWLTCFAEVFFAVLFWSSDKYSNKL